MTLSDWKSWWISPSSPCCVVYQLPPAELSEGERAVWAAQLLEWSQLYLQEPSKTCINYKKHWWKSCVLHIWQPFEHACFLRTLAVFSDWAIYQNGYPSKPARQSMEVPAYHWYFERCQWLQLPGNIPCDIQKNDIAKLHTLTLNCHHKVAHNGVQPL